MNSRSGDITNVITFLKKNGAAYLATDPSLVELKEELKKA